MKSVNITRKLYNTVWHQLTANTEGVIRKLVRTGVKHKLTHCEINLYIERVRSIHDLFRKNGG